MSNKNNQRINNIVNDNKLTKDQLSQAFVDAMIEYDRIKEEKQKQQKEKERIEFRESVGIKDYSKDKSKLKHVKEFINLFSSFIRMIFVKKKYVKGTYANTEMFKMLMYVAYKIISIVFLLFGVATGYVVAINLYRKIWLTALYYLAYLLLSFILFIWFRYCSIEIENTDDYNFVFGLFSSITAVVSLIISLIALVKGVG